ncbi:DUF397 domain-containing protein [Nocardia sp. NPDC059239]|uniref:DUF397 domain-containing protein n=1 Tax=Nocardia sp. NPDC059239 TaxID=3346785 RepID=UPI00369B9150
MVGNPALHWFKATFSSSSSSCVEVSITPAEVRIRDSKYLRDPRNDEARQPIVIVAAEYWPDFLRAVENRTPAGHDGLPAIFYETDGAASIRSGTVTLAYTRQEWEAFCAGVRAGEFDLVAVAV